MRKRALENWKSFAASLDPTIGIAANTTDENWTLVFSNGGRPLALPANRLAAPESLDFFVTRAEKWWWAQFSILLQRFLPNSLPKVELSADQHRQLQSMFCATPDLEETVNVEILAIQFGSVGPLQKVMVLGSDRICNFRVAKLALRPSADKCIVEEAERLSEISKYSELLTHVPQVSHTGMTPSGRPFFVMGAVHGEPATRKFGTPHVELLRKIFRANSSTGIWQESLQFNNINARLTKLSADHQNSLEILRAAWLVGCQAVARQPIPLCLSHGDFTAWNLLQREDRLIALDWEYAQINANPLADFFHFHLISRALDGSLRKGRIKQNELLARAESYAREVLGEKSEVVIKNLLPLLLFYLVDTVSFYAEESGGIDRSDPVVDAYLQVIAELT